MSEKLKTYKTVDTRPFRRLIATIGELPTSFVESMTYYELLAWLCDYLQNTITEAINNNAEVAQELQDKFIELQLFVDEYFDNLDVQEEIDNKLDQMAESGELQEIISAFLNANALWMFDTVADMKSATNLIDGSYAKTLGFYAIGDGGGAVYKISATGEANELDVIAVGSLFANLVISEKMNVKQFGVKGDGETDDTASIQNALDKSSHLYFNEGVYMINVETPLLPNTGNTIELNEKATLKAIANNLTNYNIVNVDNVSDVEIFGGTIEGDRDEHTGETGEWGMCISVANGASNIYIHDIKLTKAWGDGLYVNNATNVRTSNMLIDSARRNGISIISVENFKSLNDTIINTNGTAPMAGVDIEPNYENEKLVDIVFENLHTENNEGGAFGVIIAKALTTPISIKNLNHYDKGSNDGCVVNKTAGTVGEILIDSPYYELNKMRGIALARCYDSDCAIKVLKPYILNSNTSGQTAESYSAPIAIYMPSGATAGTIGNIEIVEPYIYTSNSIANFISMLNTSNAEVKLNNVKLVDPLNVMDGKFITISQPSTKITFTDKYNVTGFAFTANTNALGGRLHSEYFTPASVTSARTITLVASYEVGRKIKVRNGSTGAGVSVKLDAGDRCRQLSSNAGITITLGTYGDYIELQKLATGEWMLVNKNCEPTIA